MCRCVWWGRQGFQSKGGRDSLLAWVGTGAPGPTPALRVPCSLQMVHSSQPLTWVVQAAERPPPTDLLIQETQIPSHETPVSPNLS